MDLIKIIEPIYNLIFFHGISEYVVILWIEIKLHVTHLIKTYFIFKLVWNYMLNRI